MAISGDVHVPAIYELKGPTSVEQALRFAGGLSSTASLSRASLERLDAQKKRTVLDISLEGVGLATPLQQADILRVLPISPEFQNVVTLRGNVAETGPFSVSGTKLSDIIPDSQSLITQTTGSAETSWVFRDRSSSRNTPLIPTTTRVMSMAFRPALHNTMSTGFRSITTPTDRVNPLATRPNQPTAPGVMFPIATIRARIKIPGKTAIRTAFPTPAILRSNISMASPLDPILRGSTPRTGSPAPRPAAARWPMRRRRRREAAAAGANGRSPCARDRLVLCGD